MGENGYVRLLYIPLDEGVRGQDVMLLYVPVRLCSIMRAIGSGGPWKSRLFLAQMALTLLVAIPEPKIVEIFRSHSFQWPS
jgi:hypothetical protein